MKRIKNIILWSVLVALLAACSPARHLPFSSYALEPVTTAMLLDKIHATDNTHKYTQISKFTAEYAGMHETTNFKGFARIAQDSLLMLSLSPVVGGEAFRLLLSPDSTKSLNRLEKVYQVSDYQQAQQIIPLPYPLVEALFAYHFSSIVNPSYQLSISDGMYHLEDKRGRDHYTSLKVDGQYRVRTLQYKDFESQATVRVSYNSFLELDHQLFPQDIEVHIQKKHELIVLRISLKKVDFKSSLSFPFQVSSRYIREIN